MTVAVTGADGFAGSFLVEELARTGHTVVACIRATPLKNLRLSRNVRIAYADLLDPRSLEDAFWGVEQVYHVAAVSGIAESRAKPNSTLQINVTGTHNVIQACIAQNVSKMLYTSTCHVAGVDIYAASKKAAEDVCMAYKRRFPIVITRAHNHYGPRQRPEWVIADFIEKALTGKPIVVNSPEAVRDFTYVTDIARGYVTSMEWAQTYVPVSIGTGIGRTMRSVAEDVARLCDYSGRVEFGTPRTNDVEAPMVADNTYIGSFGWRPEVAWEDGLKETIQWYRKRLA